MEFPADAGLVEVLKEYKARPGDLSGHAGEAWVYALDQDRVKTESWTDYLRRKAEVSLQAAGGDFAAVDDRRLHAWCRSVLLR